MNKEHLQLIFDQYISRFDELDDLNGSDEGYKWRAVSCFLENWDIEADDFVSMFKAAMTDTSKKCCGFLVGHVLCFRHNAFKDRAPDNKAVAARSAFLFG